MDPEQSAAEKEQDDRRKQWLIDKMAGNSVIHAADKTAKTETETETAGAGAGAAVVEQIPYHKDQEQRGEEKSERAPPEEEKVVGTDIHVSGLAVETTEDKLRAAIETIGPVGKVSIVKDSAGVSRGFGFFIMKHESDVVKSIQGLNGYVLDERTLRVDIAKRQYSGNKSARPFTGRGSGHRGERDRYDSDRRPDRRRDDFDYRDRDAGYHSRQPVSHGSYRSGDPVGSYDRPYSGGNTGYRPVSNSYDPGPYRGAVYPSRYGDEPASRGYGPMTGDPGDRYGVERYPRPVMGAGPYSGGGTGPSPVLSRYDNRYDIMGGEGVRGLDPLPSRGRDRYAQEDPRYGADRAARQYRDAPPVARRSRSRSRDKYPAVGAPEYRRPNVVAGVYSGDGAYDRDPARYEPASAATPYYGNGAYSGSRGRAGDYPAAAPYRSGDALGYEQRTHHYEDTLPATHMSSYEEYQRQRRN